LIHFKDFIIRPIASNDNAQIAEVIRSVLVEHNAARQGTVYSDPSTDFLSDVFKEQGSGYYVVEFNGRIVGGCGFFPTSGLPDGFVELVKLYVLQDYRGYGLGKFLIELCSSEAIKVAYKNLYLETMPELGKAIQLYERTGFKMLNSSLGDSGHFSCTIWAQKSLKS
jgi:putative acetyltransferase